MYVCVLRFRLLPCSLFNLWYAVACVLYCAARLQAASVWLCLTLHSPSPSHYQNSRIFQPENLLLVDKKDDANLKIADFGFAKKHEAGSEVLRTQCGTPGCTL